MSTEQGGATGKPGEGVSLAPQWLNEGARGGAAAGWRPTAPGTKAPSRFDTSNPGQRWRGDDERAAAQRRDPTRWTGAEPERWGGEGGGAGAGRGLYTEPFGAPAAADRWGGAGGTEVLGGRGRGRPSEVESWKARGDGTDWRAPGDPAASAQPRTDWRSDRWGTVSGGVARADSWRVAGAAGGGRGFTDAPIEGGKGFGMGRGRGAIRAGSSFSSLKAGGGGIGGNVKLGRSRALHRYTTDELSRLYRQLLHAGRLKLPVGVERDDPLLFLADGEFLDVMEQFIGIDPTEAAQAFIMHYAALERQYSHPYPGATGRPDEKGGLQPAYSGSDLAVGAEKTAAAGGISKLEGTTGGEVAAAGGPAVQQLDEWIYKDPQGVVQGPFPKQDIIDWYEGGFFPLDLPIRNAHDLPDAPFRPLSALLRIWATHTAPPGFTGGAAPATPAAAAAEQAAAAAAAPAAPKVENEVAALNLPDDLHPEDDMLNAALQQMEIKAGLVQPETAPAPAPAAAPQAAPTVNDPVIDPSLVKRIPSNKQLAQLGAPSAPAAVLQQQGSLPLPAQLPYGAPGVPLAPPAATPAELEAFPFLQQQATPQQAQQQQHLGQPHHAITGAGSGFLGHSHSLDGPLLQPNQLHAGLGLGQPLLQQQLPQLHAPHQGMHAAGGAWGGALAPHPVTALQPHYAAPPAQPLGAGLSLLDIQRQEQERMEAARAAAAQKQQQQQQQVPTHLQFDVPDAASSPLKAEPAAAPSKPAAAPAMLPPKAAVAPAHQPPAVEEPAQRPRPETKAAPWVASAAKPAGSSKTLKEIQEEEAEQQARIAEQRAAEEAEAASSAMASSGPAGAGWARATAAGLVNMIGRAKSLKEIQEEEMRQQVAARTAAAVAQQQAALVQRSSGPTIGDVIDRQLSAAAPPATKSVWGTSGTTPGKQPSLREVMQYEESAADLEGGASTDFPLAPLPPPAQARPAAAVLPAAPAAAEEATDEDLLFWDYGPAAAKPAAAAAAPVPAPQAPAPQPAVPARWAAAVAAPAAAPLMPPAVAAAQPSKAANGPVAKPVTAAAPKPRPAAIVAATPPPTPAPIPAAPSVPSGPTAGGSTALQGAFREWCQQQMRALSGSDDVTLCEFLLTVEANSEVAEYITMYLGSSPAVSRFSAEFMKHKLAEAANAGKKKKGKKQQAAGAAVAAAPAILPPTAAAAAAPAVFTTYAPPAGPMAAAIPPAVAAPAVSSASAAAMPRYVGTVSRTAPPPAASDFPSLGAAVGKAAGKKDSDWEKIPKTAASSKKKKGKGLKVDSALLGFGTGTNYSVLEQPE